MIRELEQRIIALIEQYGPLTGGQIVERLGTSNSMTIWKACIGSDAFRVVNCARYYLRYDITRDDFLRLSPSVLRDFLSFTLVYLPGQKAEAVDQSAILANKHRLISLKKLRFARNTLLNLTEPVLNALRDHCCCFLAGDISYFLAHEESRTHEQLGVSIKGSDIDIIVVFSNDIDIDIVKEAEKQILAHKYVSLKNPEIAQEIDFLFKPVSKMLQQFSYRDIHEKIACKILYESFFLYGRLDLYENLLTELEYSGTVKRIEDDFSKALKGRKETIGKILALKKIDHETLDENTRSLFYFSQERLEFT